MTQMPAPTTERTTLMFCELSVPSSVSENFVCTPTALEMLAMIPAGARNTPTVASMRAVTPITAPPGGIASVEPMDDGLGTMIHGP
jgi:hypothetical protein